MQKLIFSLVLPLLLTSCQATTNLNSHLGLYRISDAKCKAGEKKADHCHQHRFIELRKGTFRGIAPGALAFVFWRVNSPNSTELAYTVFSIDKPSSLLVKGGKIIISNSLHSEDSVELEEKEYFILKNEELSEYYFFSGKRNLETDDRFNRETRYLLAKATPDEIAAFHFNYPEDSGE